LGQSIALIDNSACLLQNGVQQPLTGPGQKPVSFYWQNKAWYQQENWLFRNENGGEIDLRKSLAGDSSFFHSNR
jgi:hypothetical protein